MDNLADLPKKEMPLSRDEEETMKNLFPQDGSAMRSASSRAADEVTNGEEEIPPSSGGIGTNWKLIGYTTLLFLILTIPFIDKIVCKLPYCGENTIALMVFKTLIFALGFFLINRYVA